MNSTADDRSAAGAGTRQQSSMWQSAADRWNQLLDRVAKVGQEDPSGREAHRVRAAFSCLAIAFVAYAWVGASEFAAGHFWVGAFSASGAVSALLVGVAFRATQRNSILAHGATAVSYALAGGLTLASGGAGSGALFLLAVPPLVAAHLGGTGAGLRWAALCAATIGITALLRASGFDFPVELSPEVASEPRFLVAFCFVFGLLGVGASWEARHGRMLDFANASASRAREDRRQALESAEHYRALAELSSDLVLEVDSNGIIAFASSNAHTVLGAAPNRLVGRPVDQFLKPEKFIELKEISESIERTGTADFELTIDRPDDGRRVRVQGSVRTIEGWDHRNQRIVTVRQAPVQATPTERAETTTDLDTVARATRAIAHDLLSHLTVAAGNAELASDALIPNAKRKEFLEEVVSAAMNSGRLSRELLALGGTPASNQSELFINSLVQRFAPIATRIAGDGIEVYTQLDPHVSRVLVDPTHVERILLNLVANAREVIPDEGHIRIGTIHSVCPDSREKQCILFVEDDGPGMTSEVRERIFDAAFSTKSGRGRRGYGLGIVRDLARAARGEVRVSSTPGKGARFEVVLPIVEEEAVTTASTTAAGAPGRRVLVVNTDERVRQLLARSLESEGFRVESVASEQAALEVISRADSCVEVLLTEDEQPGVDGVELAERARAELPKLGVVILAKDPARIPNANGFVGVQSPHKRAELVRALRAAIVRSSRSPKQART